LFLAKPDVEPVRARQSTARIFPVTGGIPQRVAISPDGKMLAYPRRHRGKDSIWLADIENRSTTQVTDDQYRLHDEIEFAPDGRTIYFTAKDESHPTWTLMKVPSLGGPAVVLSDNITGGIAVSADGSRLA